MAKTDEEKPICMMRREGNRLLPSSPFDAELLAEFQSGVDIEVTFKQRRSNPQLRAYWLFLAAVVDATECAPNAKKFHETLKFEMGYTTLIKRFDGTFHKAVDSVAFSKMEQDEFTGFFKRAERLVAEQFGFTMQDIQRSA